jgi:hypothetical protein
LQLRKLKLDHQFKQNQIETIIASDPEIQSMRKKIEVSYVSKERSRQLAEKQVRDLENKALESRKEAEMLARAEAEAFLK